MRKLICLLVVFVMCLTITPVFATSSGFVPSITYKPGPVIKPVENEEGKPSVGVIRDEEGNELGYLDEEVITITSISQVLDKDVDLPEDLSDLMLEIYHELSKGELELPYDKFDEELDLSDMVIRDMIDVKVPADVHDQLTQNGEGYYEITFEMGVEELEQIYVMVYDEETGEWLPAIKTVNNGDGTVTVIFEKPGILVFSVDEKNPAPPTGDTAFPELALWTILLLGSMAAIVVLLTKRQKKR